jgi:hypothetical protein
METVRRLGNSPLKGNFYIGDLYTFGSPRVGLDDWASAARTAMKTQNRGHAWRTANVRDVVTMVPPLFPWDANFIHLDAGWQISPTQAPTRLPSEIGTTRKPPSSWDANAHRELFLFLETSQRPESIIGDRNVSVLRGSEECDREAHRHTSP